MNLYAYAWVFVIRSVKFPTFERKEHIDGETGKLYKIDCYSYAEVDFYRSLCESLQEKLFFCGMFTDEDLQHRQFVDGGYFGKHGEPSCNPQVAIRQTIDGKDYSLALQLRSSYIANIF